MVHSRDIEESIIGALICDDTVRHNIHKITDMNFFCSETKTLCNVIKYLVEKSKDVNVISVADLAAKRNITLDYVVNITKHWATVNFNSCLERLFEYTERRQYILAAKEIEAEAEIKEFDSRGDLKNHILSKLSRISNDENTSIDDYKISNIMLAAIQEIEDNYKNDSMSKTLYGLSDLDKLTAGIHKGELTVLGARPAVGKTSIAIQLALNLAFKGNNVIYFTKEMLKEKIAQRFAANLAGVDSNKTRFAKALTDEDWRKIIAASGEISEKNIYINDKCRYVEQIVSFVTEVNIKNKVDYVIVDYAGLFSTMKRVQNREREVSEVSLQLKELTLNLKVPVLLLSQLSRDNVKNNRPPCMADLRDSGSLEQDADNIFFLHKLVDEDEDEKEIKTLVDIDLIIDKQRNGPTMTVALKSARSTGRWFGKR